MNKCENQEKKKEKSCGVKSKIRSRHDYSMMERLLRGLRYGSRNHNLAFEQHHTHRLNIITILHLLMRVMQVSLIFNFFIKY
jgi:hypothetical protein